MEPLVAKIIYGIGYWLANFAIRARHIKARKQVQVRVVGQATRLPESRQATRLSDGGNTGFLQASRL